LRSRNVAVDICIFNELFEKVARAIFVIVASDEFSCLLLCVDVLELIDIRGQPLEHGLGLFVTQFVELRGQGAKNAIEALLGFNSCLRTNSAIRIDLFGHLEESLEHAH
jgi:hypothetical protein